MKVVFCLLSKVEQSNSKMMKCVDQSTINVQSKKVGKKVTNQRKSIKFFPPKLTKTFVYSTFCVIWSQNMIVRILEDAVLPTVSLFSCYVSQNLH